MKHIRWARQYRRVQGTVVHVSVLSVQLQEVVTPGGGVRPQFRILCVCSPHALQLPMFLNDKECHLTKEWPRDRPSETPVVQVMCCSQSAATSCRPGPQTFANHKIKNIVLSYKANPLKSTLLNFILECTILYFSYRSDLWHSKFGNASK